MAALLDLKTMLNAKGGQDVVFKVISKVLFRGETVSEKSYTIYSSVKIGEMLQFYDNCKIIEITEDEYKLLSLTSPKHKVMVVNRKVEGIKQLYVDSQPKDIYILGFKYGNKAYAAVDSSGGGARKPKSKVNTYKRTTKKHVDKKGVSRTIWVKGEREYVRKLSQKLGKYTYRPI